MGIKHNSKSLFWLITFAIFIGVVSSGCSTETPKVETSAEPVATDTVVKDTPKVVEEKKEENKINYDNFLKIKMGSKYESVVALIGKGTELSSSEISGINTVMYTWTGEGISNMNITVQNGLVMSKAGLGLPNIETKVNLEQYNKVKNGMSYTEVKSILGEGIIMSQNKIMDTETIMYIWTNNNASNMNCTFLSGKMMMKAQFNLK